MSFLEHLREHPFPVVAWFERVVAVSFAFPEMVLRPLVPNGLEIDTYESPGFLALGTEFPRWVWPLNLGVNPGRCRKAVHFRTCTRRDFSRARFHLLSAPSAMAPSWSSKGVVRTGCRDRWRSRIGRLRSSMSRHCS